MQHLGRWLFAALVVAFLLTCSDKKPATSECKQDGDCADGFACVDNKCVENAAATGVCGLCRATSECNPLYVCGQIEATRKACVPPCDMATSACPAGFHCADGATPGGAACVPDTAICCVDEDGDAFGAGVDCTSPDCNDANPHCDANCTDSDGDGWCIGHDCDDGNSKCDADCTDVDQDGWCVNHDCNDNDRLRTDVCPVCEIDADGDGYGVGCSAGPDCDDANPHCNVDCTDADTDGWCVGSDCDDANPHCDDDCGNGANGDRDGDGYCGVRDCDPTNGHCFSTCVDSDHDDWCAETDCNDGNPHCDADCTDVDGDGWCTGKDCNDAKPHCGAACTDSDGDTFCDDQDCDPTDPLRNTLSSCSGCIVDNDRDLHGQGCAAGPDCDDFKPHCAADCTDTDGDDYCVDQDCNDTNAAINPAAIEICNGFDDDCDGYIDAASVPNAVLCPPGPSVYTTQCLSASCSIAAAGCAPDHYDINGVFDDGCECQAQPSMALGKTCLQAIQITTNGTVPGPDLIDSPMTSVDVAGTIPEAGRVVWYRFRATDNTAEESDLIDNFLVSVSLVGDAASQFVFDAYRGGCDSGSRLPSGLPPPTDANILEWQIGTAGSCDPAGCDACPPNYCGNTEPNPSFCHTNAATSANCGNPAASSCRPSTPKCGNDSADFYIAVRRAVPITAANGCAQYRLHIKNGRY
jgi:hypothetical protein